MNYAHLHLILNHIPVVGIPLALCFLVYGLWSRHVGTQKFALAILAVIAAFTGIIYLTGEPAEEMVEHLPGIAESFIEAHEDAAEVSLVLSTITGIIALSTLWIWPREYFRRYALYATIGTALIAAASLGYTANLGGKIRHTEIRSSSAPHSEITPMETKRNSQAVSLSKSHYR